jgi:hypothetical protein
MDRLSALVSERNPVRTAAAPARASIVVGNALRHHGSTPHPGLPPESPPLYRLHAQLLI